MSSPPAPAPAPLAPGTVVAGLIIEPAGEITWQWVTFFVIGNLFAGVWLALAFLNAYPEVTYQVRLVLARLGLAAAPSHKRRSSPGGDEQPQQQQQQQHEGELQLSQDGQGAASPLAVSVASPTGRAAVSPSARGELTSPLPSRRSRPQPPPELVVEQPVLLSPRPSYTPKLAGLNSAGAPLSPGGASSSYPLFLTPTEAGAAAAAAAASAASPAVSPAPAGPEGHAAGTPSALAPASVTDSSLLTDEAVSEAEPLHVRLEWRNLCYAVNGADGPRMIVQGIYGCANPQELQGLMGPSGAGKSTLMDLLSRRTDPVASSGSSSSAADAACEPAGAAAHDADAGEAEQHAAMQHSGWPQRMRGWLPGGGQHHQQQKRSSDGTSSSLGDGATSSASADAAVVHLPLADEAGKRPAAGQDCELLVNGTDISRRAFMKISAYVPQHDNLVPTMTTLEALSFYASIILPPETTQHEKKLRITRVVDTMGLRHQSHTLVGGMLPGGILMRGLSGGEKKRLAIACGVVARPSLVFLDEPTSGLDSFAALNVVLFLKSMATQDGATLIASLHQPRSAIWGQLDQVTLLASGRLMYTGPTDSLVTWFTSLGYAYDPSTHGMASDWALDLVSLGFTKPQHETRQAQDTEADEGGLRQRGAGGSSRAALVGPRQQCPRQQQQQQRAQQAVSMMSSKQELGDAASAFLQRLRELHPDWFQHHTLPAAAPAAGSLATYKTADGSFGSAAPAMSRVRVVQQQQPAAHQQPAGQPAHVMEIDLVHGVLYSGAEARMTADAHGTVAALGGDTASSPFLQQGKQEGGALGLQEEAQEEQLVEALDQQLAEEQGFGHAMRSAWGKYKALLWRELLIATRNPADVGGRMMTFTYVSLLSGLIAWNLPGGADSIMNRISAAYAVLSFYLLMPFVFMSLFTSDKRFFAADTTARLYHPFQYWAAKSTVMLPFNMLLAVVFHLVYYGMVGMRHGTVHMAQSCVISVLMGLTAMQAVYCCAIVASSQDLAFVYAIAWTALNLLVNPYMALFNLYSLGWGFSWLRYFSPYNYAWQALVQIEMKDRGFDCNSGSGLRVLGLIPELLPQGPSFALVRNNLANLAGLSTNRQCVASGNAVIAMYTTGLPFGATVGILLGYFFAFMAVTYYVVWKSSKRRGSTL